jgi:hypothetical protein
MKRNVRRLQNGLGIAAVAGILVIFLLLALDPGSPKSAPGPALPSGSSTTPTTPAPGDQLPFAIATVPPSVTAPTTASSSSGSSRPPAGTDDDAAAPADTAAATAPTTTAEDPAPQGVTASADTQAAASDAPAPGTTASDPPAADPAAPTTTQPEGGAASAPTGSTAPVTTTTTTAPTPTAPTRQVEGSAVTLGAGDFTGGNDVAPGLYDVTTGPGECGNFVVTGTDSYNEFLDSSGTQGVPKIRVQISNGDQIQISGLSQVVFTPVSTPFVTSRSAITLYAGTWTVGQDLGPGRYVATAGDGQSGSFMIADEGVNETLGGNSSGGASSVAFDVQNGDVIQISGLEQVTLTPS